MFLPGILLPPGRPRPLGQMEATRAGFTYTFCRWKRDVWRDLAGHRQCGPAGGGTSFPVLVSGMFGALVAGSYCSD